MLANDREDSSGGEELQVGVMPVFAVVMEGIIPFACVERTRGKHANQGNHTASQMRLHRKLPAFAASRAQEYGGS